MKIKDPRFELSDKGIKTVHRIIRCVFLMIMGAAIIGLVVGVWMLGSIIALAIAVLLAPFILGLLTKIFAVIVQLVLHLLFKNADLIVALL